MGACSTYARRLGILAAMAAMAIAPAAQAAPGDGPYSPFPTTPEDRAVEFVKKLNRERLGSEAGRTEGTSDRPPAVVEQQRLDKGFRPQEEGAGQSGDTAGGPAFERAGFRSSSTEPGGPGATPFLIAAALLGAAAAAVAVRAARA